MAEEKALTLGSIPASSEYGTISLSEALEQLQDAYDPNRRLYASGIAIERCEKEYTRYLQFRQYGVGTYTIYGKTRSHDRDARDYGFVPITEVDTDVLERSCRNLFVDRYLTGRGFDGAEHLALLKGVLLLRQAAQIFGKKKIPDVPLFTSGNSRPDYQGFIQALANLIAAEQGKVASRTPLPPAQPAPKP